MKTTTCKSCNKKFRQRIRGRQRFCKLCRQKRRENDLRGRARKRMRRYNERLSAGLCPECGGFRNGDGVQCKECRRKNKESQMRTKTTERSTGYQRKLQKRRRREGLCAYCGQRAPEEGFRMCSKCRTVRRNKYHSDPEEKLRRHKYAKPKPPMPVCQICKIQHLRCSCGKYTGVKHTAYGCVCQCACGQLYVFPRWNGNIHGSILSEEGVKV